MGQSAENAGSAGALSSRTHLCVRRCVAVERHDELAALPDDPIEHREDSEFVRMAAIDRFNLPDSPAPAVAPAQSDGQHATSELRRRGGRRQHALPGLDGQHRNLGVGEHLQVAAGDVRQASVAYRLTYLFFARPFS